MDTQHKTFNSLNSGLVRLSPLDFRMQLAHLYTLSHLVIPPSSSRTELVPPLCDSTALPSVWFSYISRQWYPYISSLVGLSYLNHFHDQNLYLKKLSFSSIKNILNLHHNLKHRFNIFISFLDLFWNKCIAFFNNKKEIFF